MEKLGNDFTSGACDFTVMQPTVFQMEMTTIVKEKSTHTRGSHWILASNIGCEEGRVNMYDSVYKSIDKQRE